MELARIRRTRFASAVLAATLISAGLAGFGAQPAANAGGASVYPANDPQVTIDADGNALAVWARYDTKWTIESRYRPAGGSWEAVRTLSDATAGDPQVVTDGNGKSTAAWVESTKFGSVIRIARSTNGEEWTTPLTISSTNASNPRIAANAKGFVVVAWTRSDGTYGRIQASVRALNGTWPVATTLSPAEQDAYSPAVAMDGNGRATVVWRQDAATKEIQAASRPRGGQWATAETISDEGFDSDTPAIAADSDGNLVAAWERDNGTYTRIQVARRPAGGDWGEPAYLSKNGRDAFNAHVAVGKNGKAAVAWSRNDNTSWARVQVSRRSGGSWTPSKTLSPTEADGNDPRLAMNAGGRILLTWVNEISGTGQQVRSRIYKPGKGWSANTKMSTLSEQANEPRPAISPSGAMVAVWLWYDGTRPRVETSRRSATSSSWSDSVFLSKITP